MKIELTILKNEYLFEWLLHTNKNKAADLFFELVENYNPSKSEKYKMNFPLRNSIIRKRKPVMPKYKEKQMKVLQTIKQWPAEKATAFLGEVDKFLETVELGSEWWITIATAVLEGYFVPPVYNFSLKSKEEPKKILSLELAPYTSLDDIKDAWTYIQRRQRELWPNYKKRSFTKKSIPNLKLFSEDRLLKVVGTNGFDGKYSKVTDLDIIGRIYPDDDNSLATKAADKKKAANLRQVRHRHKSP